MADVVLQWANASGYADLCVTGADLAHDDGLQAAVLISLFSDARVAADELPEGDTDRRGWWGDGLNEDADAGIGSRLWLLERRKQEAAVPALAAGYARDALDWLIADGVAVDVEASAERAGRDGLSLRVGITLPDRTRREFQFQNVFSAP